MRGAVARQHGLDETLASKVIGRNTEDLSSGARAALLLADRLMSQPGDIDDELVAELRRHFSDSELTELTLDVMKWNYQKVAVALHIDAEVRVGELTPLEFDHAGHWIRPT